MTGQRRLCLAVAMLAMLWNTPARACNVPVFRYALERWEPDPYEIVIFHRGPLNAQAQACVDQLTKAAQNGTANLTVSLANPDDPLSPSQRSAWESQDKPSLPWIVARYPRKSRIDPPAWSGPCTAETAQHLLDSPLRKDIGQRLLRGDSAVWLLLDSGDAKADQEAATLVEAELRHLEQSLVLPKPAADDPPTSSELPLKIAFSMVRLSRTDAAEQTLVALLLNANPKLAGSREPMLFPIFGRGRAIPPAMGPEIRADALRDMGEFLTGPCSCEIKEMNPGYDLLLSADWKSLPAYQETPVTTEALVGLSQFAATATNAAPAPSRNAATTPTNSPPVAEPLPPESSPLAKNFVIVIGLGIAFVGVATLVLRANRAS